MNMNSSSSLSSVKKELMSEEKEESICNIYSRLCFDLNMDIETKEEAWRSYEHIKKHYLLEGEQIHWLAVSLYVSCRKNKYLTKSQFNPISISRLLKSANNFDLISFFDKLHKWEDMENLPRHIRYDIDKIEHSFSISSIIFEKYPNIFCLIFGANKEKLLSYDFYSHRIENEINPKLNQKNKQKKSSHFHFYQLIWTIYSLAKTIYPTTANDLIASFHLLFASILFVYQLAKKANLYHLLKGEILNEIVYDDQKLLDKLSSMYQLNSSMINVICDEYLKNVLFKNQINKDQLLNDENCIGTIRQINSEYDEIVLTNCFIDERIFLENKRKLNDLLNPLNENRNSKSFQTRTPLTAEQHLQFLPNQSQQCLTPLSQANSLIQTLNSIIQEQTTKPNNRLYQILGQQPFIDDLIERVHQWEEIFISKYNFNDHQSEEEDQSCGSCRSRLDMSIKLFYFSLENILSIDKQRSLENKINEQDIQQSFQKLMLNNDFVKSILGLCLLLVLYSHRDKSHDLIWILNIYDLHAYSFLKIIQIFLKSTKQINQSKAFVKYLSSIEETILSDMVFQENSSLWIDIQNKGILNYQFISKSATNKSFKSPNNSNSNNLTQLFNQSPISNNVKRKLFQNSTTNSNNNELSIVRSQSDGIVENSRMNVRKMSPYTMFYRKLYELAYRRINMLSIRLYGYESNQFEKLLFHLFVYLFENHSKRLFSSRHIDQIILSSIYYLSNSNLFQFKDKSQLTWFKLIQLYKSIPNSKQETLRSIFIKSIDQNDFQTNQQFSNENPCLTPSKPAGTTQIIGDKIFGDINTFYKEIFLDLPNLDQCLNEQNLIEFNFNSSKNEHLSIQMGQHLSINYSAKKIQSNLFLNSNYPNNSNSNQTNQRNSNDILSSSIQAGLNNRVQTTRIRTDDGKFLTTISTIPKLNPSNDSNENNQINSNKQFLFGHSIKRTLSNDSNSNSLHSLTKKVLQIENDRANLKE